MRFFKVFKVLLSFWPLGNDRTPYLVQLGVMGCNDKIPYLVQLV